ncbi:MAG: hypothetical protein M1820_001350 [Bogoriella megaspora]|nr:MAG: hypothetical protein M1820_001350 [Bogoriella megaspora]
MSERSTLAAMLSPASATSRAATKPQRVLACVLCQQRKIKCNREIPCSNCLKSGAQCVPAVPTARQRRRRFPERDLLERLNRYESLLRQHKIDFEPLHSSTTEKHTTNTDDKGYESHDDVHSEARDEGPDVRVGRKETIKSETIPEDADDNGNDDEGSNASHHEVRRATVKKALGSMFENGDDALLFGSRKVNIDLSSLHPAPAQILRHWQIYCDNINALLKITHTPTLQTRIIDAISNIANISPSLEALMFSIYCTSLLSLSEDESRVLFGSGKKDLLTNYHFACQQALLRCGILRTSDRDCLTALYLYLHSVRPESEPRSMFSMFGITIRIAQHMGIHSESANSKYTTLEAEMRRRLWWSLVLFDSRLSEMSDSRTTMLMPTWDCKTPTNVNDFDLRPEMKGSPPNHVNATEAMFIVVRSEMADFLRYCAFYFDFISPALKPLAKDGQRGPTTEGGEMEISERMMEDKYLKSCNPEIPLHFVTLWSARWTLAKNRLLEHYSKYSRPSVQQTDAQRDAAVYYALHMFECDTKLRTSPLSKGFLWHIDMQFPFQAYVHILQDLRRRPFAKHASRAWQAMNDNFGTRFMDKPPEDNPLIKIMGKLIVQAWGARVAGQSESAESEEPPTIVTATKQQVTQMTPESGYGSLEQRSDAAGMGNDDFAMFMPMPMEAAGHSSPYVFGWPEPTHSGFGTFPNASGRSTMNVDVNQLDWTMMDWNPMRGHGQ